MLANAEVGRTGFWLPVLARVVARVTGVTDQNVVQNNGKSHRSIMPLEAVQSLIANRSEGGADRAARAFPYHSASGGGARGPEPKLDDVRSGAERGSGRGRGRDACGTSARRAAAGVEENGRG